jgi:hypothetical protein
MGGERNAQDTGVDCTLEGTISEIWGDEKAIFILILKKYGEHGNEHAGSTNYRGFLD